MRIASLNQDAGIAPGREKGAAVHLAAMRRAFDVLGHDVVVLDEPDPRAARELLEAAHAEAPLDMVYERFALDADTGSRFCTRHRIPHTVEINAPLLEEEVLYRGGKATAERQVCERRVLSEASLVLAVSSAVATYATQRGANPEAVLIHPNGVDTDVFHPRPRDEGLSDPRLARVRPGDLVLGFHGRLRPWHGGARLVAVVAELLARDLPVHLLVVGRGDWDEEIAERLPASAWTHVPWASGPELGRLVARFDAVALTYPPDRPCWFSPLKLVEAMAVGAVPVVPEMGDLASLVTHEVDGLVVPVSADVTGFVEALAGLVSDPERRLRLSQAAASMASGRAWTHVAADVVDHIAGLASA